MPIYEFYCQGNNKIYSFFARSLALSDKTPRCPDGAKHKLERMVSSFAFIGRAKEKVAGADADMDDPRMDAMMAEMEREFTGMDDENPDPRSLARMMRKMSSITGQDMPSAVEEMISRMEKGEDPEKLEAEYGDALEGYDPMGGEGDMPEGGGDGEDMKTMMRRKLGRPRRDPTLYEMSDFVD